MSEFSQSFFLGDHTLEKLDRQAAKTPTSSACSRRTTRSSQLQKQHGSNEQQQLEIIDESPTNSTRAGGNETRQRSVRERLKTIGTQSRSRKGIRRNKSESRLGPENQPQRRQQMAKCRSESREQLNLLENEYSELFRSDIHFDGTAGKVADKNREESREQVVNISKFLESDISFDIPQVQNEENRPPDAKISRKSDEYSQVFGNDSDFSMDLVPRSQSLLASTRCSNKLENLFDQSVFTLDQPAQSKQSVPAASRYSLSNLVPSEDLLGFSELHKSLRVEDTESDVEEIPLPVENVTFTQIPAADADERQLRLKDFLTHEVERSKHTVIEAVKSDKRSAPLSVTLSQSNSFNISKVNPPRESDVRSTSNETMTLCGTKNLRLVANWGLPEAVVKAYAKKGITELFQWQSDCLANAKVILECANLVYSAPTSGGKTIVSEFLAAKTVVERKRKAIVILPFVAVAREKMYYLQEIFSPAGIRVEGFFGGHNPPGGFDSVDVAVCTIEKANSIVNRLLEQQKLADIGLIVVDEVHLISDPSRGYILELLLTKVRFVCAKLTEQIQIVAMSATLPNMELLTEWLQAEQFRTDFRPIELKEMLKLGTCIYDNQKKLIRKLDTEQIRDTMNDQDNIAQLCLETILEGCSVIVFCPSKDWCERLAKHLAEFIYTLRKSESELGEKLRAELDQQKLDEALSLLKNCPTGLDAVLGTTARYGCVYHHAGLTADERDIIESCFKNGTIRIIVATSTLSSGVNLPARRVIIRTPLFGGAPMNPLTYRQMIGRAGRKGRDVLGESILMCDGQNVKAGWGLVKAELKPIASCLEGERHSHLKRAILEIIASGVASTTADLETFVNCTLYSCEKKCPFSFNLDSLKGTSATKRVAPESIPPEESLDKTNPIASCVRFLLEYEFIRLQHSEETNETFLVSTSLGSACLAASMPPLDGFLLFSELQKSRQCFVLETELHAIYLVTPYSVSYQWQNIDWMAYLDRIEHLSGAEKRVAELVGVREAFLVKALRGNVTAGDNQLLQIHKRFYTALALQELVNEKPLSAVAKDFVCTRGLLQSLQQVAATFAGIVTSFCTSLNWNLLAMIVSQFRERLYFGVQQDLLDLMRIPSLNGQRARLLFDGGITGLVDLASADPLTVEKILYNCVSFQTEQKREDEDEFAARKRMNLRNLYVTGRAGFTIQEAAKLMVKEARTYIQLDMGVCNPEWNDSTQQTEEEKQASPREMPESENLFSPERNDEKVERSEVKQTSIVSFEISEADSNREIECFHNSLIMNFSHILDDDKESICSGGKYDSIRVVDLCASRPLFQRFCEVLQKSTSISLAFAFSSFGSAKSVIGGNLLINQQQSKSERDEIVSNYQYVFGDNLYLSGAAFTFQESGDEEHNSAVYYLNFRKDDRIDHLMKQQVVRELFHRDDVTVDMFDAKDQLKLVYRSGLLSLTEEMLANLRDPKVACWLLQAEEKVIPMQAMVEQYCPEMSLLCQLAGRCPGSTAPGLNYMSTIDAKTRCTVESFLVSHMMQAQLQQFEPNMLGTFTSREMPIQAALVRMELVGFPADSRKLVHLIERLKQAKERISVQVRKLNGGRKLDFGSSSEVAAALKVPRDRNGRAKTTRQVLERIDSPLAALVIAYRKIESNLSRTIEPLLRAIGNEGKRICGSSFCLTSTGRITMHEPNLQNVVKDFKVEIDPGQVETFSCRGTFVCSDSTKVLLSADFRQLELCVLTHLSQDRKLLAVLSGGKDVFRGIAAKWYKIDDEQQVSDELRNATKAIVYGVIYGMGARSMSGELNVDEDTARTLMEQFHSTYPEIRRYTDRVVQVTRERGYIETLTGRRRYLPAIHSTDSKKRAEAERQAVCTTIQGSAADILKNAVLRMMRNLRKYRATLGLGQVELVLHMHDELIFEVPRDQARKVAKILKSSMENCAKLSLPLRVKVKSGVSWGDLQELNV